MAIIKCPECGQEVSDKAPYCPHCGVKIAGEAQPQPSAPEQEKPSPEQPPQKKNSLKTPLIVGAVLCLIIIGTLFYFYKSSNQREQQRQYDYAMQSTDTTVLRQFLDNYSDAPEEWQEDVRQRLEQLKTVDADWNNVLVSGSKTSYEEYIANHPDSPHKAEAMLKIDSIDWSLALSTNSVDAYKNYLEEHPNGTHVDEANDNIKNQEAKTVQPEEQQMLSNLFEKFFDSIGHRDEERLTACVSQVMSSFLGKQNASRSDVVTFMHKLYRQNIAQMSWSLPGDFTISKKDVGDEEYEYTVSFPATQQTETTDGDKASTKYRIQARVNPNGQIAEFTMTRILQ